MRLSTFYILFGAILLCGVVGCSTQKSTATDTANTNVEAHDNSASSNDGRTVIPNTERAYVGCWIGSRRGAIEIRPTTLLELNDSPATAKKYSFRELDPGTEVDSEISFLVELDEKPKLFCVEKVNLITVRRSEEIYIQNYKSYDDFLSGRSVGYCSLLRLQCK